jgi:hypothetical protein
MPASANRNEARSSVESPTERSPGREIVKLRARDTEHDPPRLPAIGNHQLQRRARQVDLAVRVFTEVDRAG